MSNFYFDYEKFYNYYSDVSNLETNNETPNPDIYYYSETPNNIQMPIVRCIPILGNKDNSLRRIFFSQILSDFYKKSISIP